MSRLSRQFVTAIGVALIGMACAASPDGLSARAEPCPEPNDAPELVCPPEPPPVVEDVAAPIPHGGQWVTLEILNGRVHFAARAYPGDEGSTSVIRVVNFRFRRPDGRWDTGCHADVPTDGLYQCNMNINRLPRGEIKLGFDVHGEGETVTESPDGFRYLFVDR